MDANGNFVRLTPGATASTSALNGAPVYKRDSTITPKDASGMYYAVNTMQPPYQPSGLAPVSTDSTRLYADATQATYLPPQTQTNIGDLLNAKKSQLGVVWRRMERHSGARRGGPRVWQPDPQLPVPPSAV